MFKAFQFKANGQGADFIMNTENPTTNSLKSFIQQMENQYQSRKKNKVEEKENGADEMI